MATPSRRITATISLEETTDGDLSYPSYRDLVETKITISLPVPNEDGLPGAGPVGVSGMTAPALTLGQTLPRTHRCDATIGRVAGDFGFQPVTA